MKWPTGRFLAYEVAHRSFSLLQAQKRVFASNFHCIGMQLVAAVLCFMDIVCAVFFHNHRSLVIGETELTVLPFPLLCMRAQQHGQNTNISPYQHGSAQRVIFHLFILHKLFPTPNVKD